MTHVPNTSENTTQNPPKISRAEKIFDWLVYGGIAGIGTFILTIPTTYWAKYGGGAKWFERCTQKLIKSGFKPSTAEQLMMTNATMQGGNFMVLPVKGAEDNKIACVDTIGYMIGEKQDHSALEQEDKQSWSSIIKARLLAWTTVFASLKTTGHIIGVEKFAAFEESFAKNVVCKPLGKATHDALGKETRAFKLGKIGAIDLFATAAATTLLYIGSRVFAHWERVSNEESKHTKPSAVASHPTNASAPLDTQETETKPNRFVEKMKPAEHFVDRVHTRSDSAAVQIA